MKRKLLALLLASLVILSLLVGCGAGSSQKSADYDMVVEESAGEYFSTSDSAPAEPEAPMAAPEEESIMSNSQSETGGDAINGGGEADLSEKIIYSMDAHIETMDFDGSIEKVSELLERFGGFVENSSVSGVDLYSRERGYTVTRYADYTLRIPSENYGGMTESLSEIGNVTNRSSYAENITTQFYDSQSRLNAYRTEEERLLSMLEKVEDVESMIVIEERLSEIRYQIENLETKLLNWQRQVDYSTVYLYIEEVAVLTEEKPIVRTYWEQVADSFTDSLQGIGRFFKQLLKGFVGALPVLVLLAVVAAVVLVIVKKINTKRKKKKMMKQQNNTEKDNTDA
ncbi:MAG: DUF4349 domain-containing protein [Ruminococcaceae bacterium]|nr:DUF4349 domain-containing protein [Oscillospiraceae bacterium]